MPVDAGVLCLYVRSLGHPVQDVRIGVVADRQTWSLTCAPGTSEAEIAAALAALRGVDVSVLPTFRLSRRLKAQTLATVLWTLRRILGRAPTPAEVQTAKTEWATIFQNLN